MTTTTHIEMTEPDPPGYTRYAYLGGLVPVPWDCPVCGFTRNGHDNDTCCWGCDSPKPTRKPVEEWRCGNGHMNSIRFQRCCVCDATVYDDDPDYSDDEVRRA